MWDALAGTWPWYVAGPLIGIVVPVLLLVGGKVFGISANLRHMCAAAPAPARLKPDFLRYDWRRAGSWNLVFVLGVAAGGWLAVTFLGMPDAGQAISEATRADLAALGVQDFSGLVPGDLFNWAWLRTPSGLLVLGMGGFLVGFGARWAGGCTSGHAISGLADFQLPSLVAVVGFFAGGLLVTFGLLPLILGLGA
jgi:uncharacterized protein